MLGNYYYFLIASSLQLLNTIEVIANCILGLTWIIKSVISYTMMMRVHIFHAFSADFRYGPMFSASSLQICTW